MACRKRMAGCSISCLHRQTVEEYRAARQAQEEKREQETAMYDAEMAEYGTIIHFSEWLKKGRSR
jgi:hypothetical protein